MHLDIEKSTPSERDKESVCVRGKERERERAIIFYMHIHIDRENGFRCHAYIPVDVKFPGVHKEETYFPVSGLDACEQP